MESILNIKKIIDNMIIETETQKDTITVKWKGMIDTDNHYSLLSEFINELHAACVKDNIKHVISRFNDLKFCNSSGIKEIIKWCSMIRESEMDIVILYSTKHMWQDITFETIKIMIEEVVLKIEDVQSPYPHI